MCYNTLKLDKRTSTMEKLNIQKQLDSFTNKRLPYWEDFPDFELYMDQLVNLGNRYLTGFLGAPLTPSMINSYVKKGLMSRPVKKKYNATHLAELLVISLLSLSKLTKHVIINAVIYKMVGEHLLQYKSKHDHI